MAEYYRSRVLSRYPHCIHTVTTKESSLAYEGSLALHTGQTPNMIIGNRKVVADALGVDSTYHFVVANQTHSDNISIITEAESRGWHSAEDAIAECDAMITDQKGVVLTVLTADCVPVLLFDPVKEVIAVVHAGWRGTKSQIVAKTVAKMQENYGCQPEEIVAFVAPSIGRCCYEVGEDVAGHFEDEEAYDRNDEKYMLDLPLINQKQLLDAGLNAEHIEMSEACTSCEVDRFFSYRKEQGCSGRFMSMIGLKA